MAERTSSGEVPISVNIAERWCKRSSRSSSVAGRRRNSCIFVRIVAADEYRTGPGCNCRTALRRGRFVGYRVAVLGGFEVVMAAARQAAMRISTIMGAAKKYRDETTASAPKPTRKV